MKQTAAIVLCVAVLCVLTPCARADDAADVIKLAHELLVDYSWVDFDKVVALGRPQDAGAFQKLPDDIQGEFHDLEKLAQVQDIRRQLADEIAKAISFGPPAFTPDNTCAIVTATPVAAEARNFCVLMNLYMTYLMTAQQNKSQGLPMPKVEDIRAQILAPGSPQQQELDDQTATFSKHKIRLQLEKTPAGWRINLHAFQAALNPDSGDSP